MHRRMLALSLILCPALFAWDNDRYREDFRYSYKLNSNGRVSLEGFNGSIDITGWDRTEIEVAGTKYASNEDLLRQIKINITNSDDSIYIKADKPFDRSWWQNGGGGVKFVIRVPKKIQLDRIASSNGSVRVESIDGSARLTTSNGAIRVAYLNGSLDASTSNGTLELRDINGGMMLKTSNGTVRADNVKGSFEAHTSNGAIRARLSQVPSSSPIRVSSSNGTIDLTLDQYSGNDVRASTSNSSITLNLPPNVNAQLRAVTSNAHVSTDYEITVRGSISKNRIEGKIGNGGPLIDLSSSNGSIKIQKL